MKPESKTATAIAAFSLLATQPAVAYFTNKMDGKASIGPIAIELIDMDTSDGVSPWIDFVPSRRDNDTRAHARAARHGGHTWDFGADPWAPVSAVRTASLWASSVVARASLVNPAGSFAEGASFIATGFGDSTSATRSGNIIFDADVYARGFFLLSPNTKVVLSALGAVSVSMAAGPETIASISSSAGMGMAGVGADGTGEQVSANGLSVGGGGHWNSKTFFDDSRTGELRVSFLNLTGAQMSGTYWGGAATHSLLTVPESAAYLMLLVGLGVVGIACRRREGSFAS